MRREVRCKVRRALHQASRTGLIYGFDEPGELEEELCAVSRNTSEFLRARAGSSASSTPLSTTFVDALKSLGMQG